MRRRARDDDDGGGATRGVRLGELAGRATPDQPRLPVQ